jgi:thiol-disulfide isomerase/thioredoxin
MTRSRDSRREAARARDGSSPSPRFLLPILGVAVVVVAAIAAIALTSGSNGGGASSPIPSASGSAGTSAAPGPSGAPVITGAALPTFTKTAGDPAVGQTIPAVEGSNFSGAPVSIALDGKPKVILFLAHWCSHCQAEVPVMQAWLDAGGAPEGVELISVATAIDATLPNYPPEEWLAREGWTVPVIVDRTGSVATAYGLSAFPFWVFVNADGTVKGRMTGELPIADIETIIASLGR